MEELLKKISNYQIFNYLFPGALVTYYLEKLYQISLGEKNIFIVLCCYYVIGLITSRLGALSIETTIKLFISFVSYSDYIKATKKDPLIHGMMSIANMYRTLCIIPLLMLILGPFKTNTQHTPITFYILTAIAFFVFLFSYIRQIVFIIQRAHTALHKQQGA